MRYAQFDYHPVELSDRSGSMAAWWSNHWDGRRELREDLEGEALWPTVEDILREPGLVLEAGCGVGQWVQFLARRGHRVVGVDYAVNALRVGKTVNSDLRLVSADLMALPFAAESFDYVVSLGAVEHDVRGPEAALREFNRVLRPGGRLLCSVPCLNVERTILLGWSAARDWLKQRETLRGLAGKREPFEFYEYLFSPGDYRTTLKTCRFQTLALRTYGTSSDGLVTRALARIFHNRIKFYNPHMMMAVCQKVTSESRASEVLGRERAERAG
jgi:SAM-dependent methyltransferase